MEWNGSYLGSFPETIILDKWRVSQHRYMTLTINENTFHCMYVRANDSLPCIIDEIKPLFGIIKFGSHRLRIKGKGGYVIYFLEKEGENPIWETPISVLPKDHCLLQDSLFRFQVRKVILFRDILGLTHMRENAITIRRKGEKYVPLSSLETNIVMKKGESHNTITKKILDKWFIEVTPTSVLQNYFRGDHILSILRSKIEDTIERIDRDYLWLGKDIIERLMRRMLY